MDYTTIIILFIVLVVIALLMSGKKDSTVESAYEGMDGAVIGSGDIVDATENFMESE